MKISELAKQLSLPLPETKCLIAELGLDPESNEIDDEIAQAAIDLRKGINIPTNAQLTGKESSKEPTNGNGKKRGGKLAKTTGDALTQSVAGAHISSNQIVRTMLVRRIMANVALADMISRAGELAFMRRMQQNEVNFAQNFISTQDADLEATLQQLDGEVEGILKGLGVADPNECLVKSQAIKPNQTILEDLATIHPDQWLVRN